jgi:DnaJ-class molecular chaperone
MRVVSDTESSGPVELSTCPHCNGKPRRNVGTMSQYHDGELVAKTDRIWVCDLCAGEGRIDRDIAREVWLNPDTLASA